MDLIMSNQLAINEIYNLNKITERYGLILSKKQITSLIKNRNTILKEFGRIEIGSGILEDIIYEFCDSLYIDKNNYYNNLIELTRVFYLYQDELENKLTDEQIIKYMKDNFDNICGGSIEFLESECLEKLKNELYS